MLLLRKLVRLGRSAKLSLRVASCPALLAGTAQCVSAACAYKRAEWRTAGYRTVLSRRAFCVTSAAHRGADASADEVCEDRLTTLLHCLYHRLVILGLGDGRCQLWQQLEKLGLVYPAHPRKAAQGRYAACEGAARRWHGQS